MKKNYFLFFLFIFLIINITFGQHSNAKDVSLNLSKVSKNVTEGIKSYNLEDLKYHAKISKKAIHIVERLLEKEQCYNAADLSNSISIYLETAILAEELVNARTYLTKTEDLIIKAFYEYDICSTEESDNNNNNNNNNTTALSDLEQQQLDLKTQQAALEQKAKEIKLQLANQEVKKKDLFIAENTKAISENIKAYNNLLKSCNCEESISTVGINKANLITKSLEQIRTYYLDEIINISEIYLTKLKSCKQ
ncbi:hypothetical protein [uncultured Lacinutrix sp.]|uniref:hypothetical protein n=1 Tax=uncultured Lacinutrix sp. TaxID=574032 RepID=UPI00263176BD|nr:hypothetical protein [uncultured Lacinutrix sp.]